MSKTFDKQLRAAFRAGVEARAVSEFDLEAAYLRFRATVADGPDDEPVPVSDDAPTSSATYWHWD